MIVQNNHCNCTELYCIVPAPAPTTHLALQKISLLLMLWVSRACVYLVFMLENRVWYFCLMQAKRSCCHIYGVLTIALILSPLSSHNPLRCSSKSSCSWIIAALFSGVISTNTGCRSLLSPSPLRMSIALLWFKTFLQSFKYLYDTKTNARWLLKKP